MDGEKNLIPLNMRTKEEQREIARAGGIKSGEARRRKKQFRETAAMVLEMKPDIDAKVLRKMGYTKSAAPTTQLIMVLALAQKAMKGDVKAAALLLEMTGEDARSTAARDRLEIEREKMLLSVGGAIRAEDVEQDQRIIREPDEPMIDLSTLTDDELAQYQAACELVRKKGEVKENADDL